MMFTSVILADFVHWFADAVVVAFFTCYRSTYLPLIYAAVL